MEVRAHYKNVRLTPRKLRILRNVVRGLSAVQAQAQLQFVPGKAADVMAHVLKSAIANAEHNFSMLKENLTVTDIVIDEGYRMKRSQPRSKGMANPIVRRTSHVTVIVEDRTGTATPVKKRKTNIATITPEELAQVEAHDHEHDHGHGDEAMSQVDKAAERDESLRSTKKSTRKEYRRKSM